jgi:hypothetical protein
MVISIKSHRELDKLRALKSGLGITTGSSYRRKPVLLYLVPQILCQMQMVTVTGYISRGPGFDSRHYKKKVMGLERGPLSLLSATGELLGSNSSDSSLESREYGLGIRHADHVAPSIRKKLALTSLTCGGRLVGIVRLRTEAVEFFY